MKITKKEKTALGKVAMEMLADRITGVEKGRNLADVLPRRSITIKLDAELADLIDGYAKRAKTTRTEVVETMLWYGVEEMNNLDGTTVQGFLDLEAAKGAKK